MQSVGATVITDTGTTVWKELGLGSPAASLTSLLYRFHKSYCSCFIKSTQADLENELMVVGS